MKRENLITENLASGILDTDKPLVYGIINTDNYDVMGYYFIAGDSPECLKTLGCWDEDVIKADGLRIGETLSADWPSENAIIIVKIKDSRLKG